MAMLRKIVLGLLLAAAAGVLTMASWELWNYHAWSAAPLGEARLDINGRARLLEERMDLLTKRVGDMQLLVLILLGTSGLYAIVFVASSYFSAASFARQADQTIAGMQDQIGIALGDLRELQEETEQRLRDMAAAPAVPPVPAAPAHQEVPAPPGSPAEDWQNHLTGIAARLERWQDAPLDEPSRRELVEDEYAVIRLEAASGLQAAPALAELYVGFARIYGCSGAPVCDPARSRFYLERAMRFVNPESELASEIHYQLACRLAASRDFPRAMSELAAAFDHQFKTLDERLASDMEEGGKLYELASTPPYDKAVNDLLLNMSIGIG
jgi:hypothetical protein